MNTQGGAILEDNILEDLVEHDIEIPEEDRIYDVQFETEMELDESEIDDALGFTK